LDPAFPAPGLGPARVPGPPDTTMPYRPPTDDRPTVDLPAVDRSGTDGSGTDRTRPDRGRPPAESSAHRPAQHPITAEGLPRRTRRAHLAPELRRDAPREALPPSAVAGPRSPEEIRAMMSSFQTNFGRGLADGHGSADGDDTTT
jgi:hypothetical protein